MTRYPEAKMLIGGTWSLPDPQPVTNPFDESEIGVRAQAARPDLERAVGAAQDGMKAWVAMGPAGREAVMSRAANILRGRAGEVAAAITLEQGKTLAEARAEVMRAADNIEWDGHEGRRVYGRIVPGAPGYHNAVYRQPVGVVAGFAPWNFPIASPSRKIGAPLAAGCAVILKAAEETPAGAYELVRALVDAGLPDGAVNLVYGNPSEVSDYLIPHPAVRMVTFTGSVPVGKHLTAMAGAHMKPALMELGGHAPAFVSHTADLDTAAKMLMTLKAVNAGQVCISPTRFFVEKEIYKSFATLMADHAKAIVVGNGMDSASTMGPLISARRLEAVDGLIADAKGKGAALLSGGKRYKGPGFAYPMTVLGEVPDDAAAMRDEPFGPIALLTPVDNVEDAIERANSVPYGLAGYAFTQSARDIGALTERLEVGNLAINQLSASDASVPFGGVKDSGMGREGGTEGVLAHTVAKTVSTFFG